MNQNEIRVGNLVMLDNEVTTIGVSDFGSCKFFKPIPLSKLRLKDFGFEPVKGWDDMIFWRLKNHKLDDYELEETLQGFSDPNGNIIKDIHTLQNTYFYYTLTGEELEF